MSADSVFVFFFSSRRRHTRCYRDWSSDVSLPICAEGLLCGMLADGTGFALKTADGAARALGPAVAAFLGSLGAELPALAELPLTNSRGERVGTIAVGEPSKNRRGNWWVPV